MKNQTEALEQASVKQYCKAVRVPTVGANFISLSEQAVKRITDRAHIIETGTESFRFRRTMERRKSS